MLHYTAMNNLCKTAVGSLVIFLSMGCGAGKKPAVQPAPDTSGAAPVLASGPVSESRGFSWVVPGELAAMPLPGRDRRLEIDAAFLEQEGVRVLVSLTEELPDGEVLAARSIEQVHIPVRDYTPPTLKQISDFVAVVEGFVAAGKPVGVHCEAGLGRSGTMAAAYLVAEGSTAEDAIAAIRRLRPGSIETPEQEEAVRHFETHLAENR